MFKKKKEETHLLFNMITQTLKALINDPLLQLLLSTFSVTVNISCSLYITAMNPYGST